MTRCLPLGEGGPLCPLPLATYPSKAASNGQGCSPFSGLDDVLQNEGTADLSCLFTTGPLPCTFWGALGYKEGRCQDLGPTRFREEVG